MKLCGCPLDISLYKHGVRALKDDFEDVRMGGLNLIWYVIMFTAIAAILHNTYRRIQGIGVPISRISNAAGT